MGSKQGNKKSTQDRPYHTSEKPNINQRHPIGKTASDPRLPKKSAKTNQRKRHGALHGIQTGQQKV
ncbi:hypothetical protein MA16_Dca011685 [Dendrobium catenatum]|uniref:Uncharacterized protein n=1 Tax=Dendrobium catenatum TaxID=906689 RepID=A0A2I0WY26_9ASPA|nr:hypothetical protein MA16_Dca011685 [Dendrobium catenatum]